MSKMLIDGRHPEETRVVVARGNKIDDFDFESADKKQLKGNIYLARVTRVEPSLQAAFVEYGGNRHGFLAFSEIHPDYYQIPHEDRAALIAEERQAFRDDADDSADDTSEAETVEPVAEEQPVAEADAGEERSADEKNGDDAEAPRPEITEAGATEEAQHEAQRSARRNVKRRYKIQEVIKKRQILLVQVVKEERGGKGAALTTYMSLAGRYCVLMPNTLNGGGISRKISNSGDRKRLKDIMGDLVLPDGMACIIRTAGLKRTKTEIKRDFDYLTRLWDEIREKTLKSVAPALVYEDSSLIKRAIRDIYSREIDEIIVDGEESYRNAREFMKLLMPSHAKRVQLYRDRVPIFHRHQVETQLETMFHPTVQLKSGGYLVINPTEALVSIDINSGRATKEHNIEETATKTNLEAADEIARQLRLRDMAGLVVIDFIDMEDNRNIRKVEKQLKEALKNDRARIQVGRISQFGLMEMSRQRLRTGVLEASTHTCEHCKGTGFIRSVPSSALYTLRAVEEEMIKGRAAELTVFVAPEVAIYLLNKKRAELHTLEMRYGILLDVQPKVGLNAPDVEIERIGTEPAMPVAPFEPITIVEEPDDDIPDDIEDEEIAEEASEDEASDAGESGGRRERQSRDREDRDDSGRRRRRKRRRGRGDRDGSEREGGEAPVAAVEGDDTAVEAPTAEGTDAQQDANDERGRRKRRRGRRGGRNRQREDGPAEGAVTEVAANQSDDAPEMPAPVAPAQVADVTAVEVAEPVVETEAASVDADAVPVKKPVKRSRARKAKAEADATPADQPVSAKKTEVAEVVEIAPVAAAEVETLPPEGVITNGGGEPVEGKSSRRGWWQRTFG
jgi:ribonuclease E